MLLQKLNYNQQSILLELAIDEQLSADQMALQLLKQKLDELSIPFDEDIRVLLTNKGFEAVNDGKTH